MVAAECPKKRHRDEESQEDKLDDNEIWKVKNNFEIRVGGLFPGLSRVTFPAGEKRRQEIQHAKKLKLMLPRRQKSIDHGGGVLRFANAI